MVGLEDSVNTTTRTVPSEFEHNDEVPTKFAKRKQGGWITFPFIAVGLTGLTIAAGGWMTNLIVYLIEQYNIKSIQATKISNVIYGSTSLLPIAGAILADSLLGNFIVVSFSSFISLLGLVLLTLTATLHSLRPAHCKEGSETCKAPTQFQYTVLYSAIILLSIGMGGTRFTIATMGADQLDKAKDQGTFFNWFFFTLYTSMAIGITAIVYVENNVNWGLGFGLCLVLNAIGLAIFISGKRYYRYVKPQGSPFMSLARVIVAAIKKKKVPVPSESKNYYYGDISETKSAGPGPTASFRFLNSAAIITESETQQDGKVIESWSLCTVQQVEDLKNLIRIFPLWSTGIFLSTPLGIQMSLLVLQALRMNRSLGPHFDVPAGSFLVFTLISTAIALSVIDRFFFPMWKKLAHHTMTPLVRIGIGHVLNIIGMAGSAIVEAKRLSVARSHNLTHQEDSIVPMSAFWLVAPLAIVGVGEAFHFPGQVALYYQEFPVSLRNTATAMISLQIACGFYLSTALIDLFQRITGWLPDNINEGRIDNVFWVLVVTGLINLAYYIACTMLYRYKNPERLEQDSENVIKG